MKNNLIIRILKNKISLKNLIPYSKFKFSKFNNMVINKRNSLIKFQRLSFSEQNKNTNNNPLDNKDDNQNKNNENSDNNTPLDSNNEAKIQPNSIIDNSTNTENNSTSNENNKVHLYSTKYNYNKEKFVGYASFALFPALAYFVFKTSYNVFLRGFVGVFFLAPYTLSLINVILGTNVFVKDMYLINNDIIEAIDINDKVYSFNKDDVTSYRTYITKKNYNVSTMLIVAKYKFKFFQISPTTSYKDEDLYNITFPKTTDIDDIASLKEECNKIKKDMETANKIHNNDEKKIDDKDEKKSNDKEEKNIDNSIVVEQEKREHLNEDKKLRDEKQEDKDKKHNI